MALAGESFCPNQSFWVRTVTGQNMREGGGGEKKDKEDFFSFYLCSYFSKEKEKKKKRSEQRCPTEGCRSFCITQQGYR